MVAEKLYASPLFFKSRRYAQANFDGWLILSAKYGLVRPDQVIEPYDRKITTLSATERQSLATIVKQQASRLTAELNVRFSSICGAEYDTLLRTANIPFEAVTDLALPIGKKLKALSRLTDPNGSEGDLDAAYKIIRRLTGKYGLKTLRELIKEPIPDAGIYLFFDEAESRLRNSSELRIVRVGTHGVASGSKASLRTRIRTHLGNGAGEGNHRSSIFRLHVGASLMNAKSHPEIHSWGDAAPSKRILATERTLEQAVSRYLGNLLVAFVSVPGLSEKSNDRAYLEQNLIALLSNVYSPLDPPSLGWLGLTSVKRDIRKSGLWNVNHTGQRYEKGFLEVLDYYVSLTVGKKPQPSAQMAPANWIARVRQDTRQFSLL